MSSTVLCLCRKHVNYFNERQYIKKCQLCQEDIVVNYELMMQTAGEDVNFICTSCCPLDNIEQIDKIERPSDLTLNILRETYQECNLGHHADNNNDIFWQKILDLCKKNIAKKVIEKHYNYLQSFFLGEEKYNQEIFDEIIKAKLVFNEIKFEKDNPWSDSIKKIIDGKYSIGDLETSPDYLWNYVDDDKEQKLHEKLKFLMSSENKYWTRLGLKNKN